MTTALCVSIEASGDLLLAELIKLCISQCTSDLTLIGIGGEYSQRLGLNSFLDPRELAAHGFTEAMSVLSKTIKAVKQLKRLCREADILLLVDAPEINLRLVKWVRSHQDKRLRTLPIIYLAPPQAWAWRAKRVQAIALANEVACLFPFETDWMKARGVNAHYVGHPLVALADRFTLSKQRRDLPSSLKVALFPGSRRSSVRRALPISLEGVALYIDQSLTPLPSNIHLQLAHSAWIDDQLYLQTIKSFHTQLIKKRWKPQNRSKSLDDDQKLAETYTWTSQTNVSLTLRICKHSPLRGPSVHSALIDSEFAICHAGTATLECALAGVPPLVIAPLSWLSQVIIKRLITIKHCSLPNLCLDERIFPELSLDQCTASAVSSAMTELCSNSQYLHDATRRLRAKLTPLRTDLLERLLVPYLHRSTL